MLYIKQHSDGDKTVVTVIDSFTGEMVSTSNTEADYDDVVAIINRRAESGDSIGDIKKEVEDLRGNQTAAVREKYGIVIDTDKIVVNGREFPAAFSRVFKGLVGEDGAKRLVKFTELLEANPLDYAGDALVEWIIANPSLEILEDGRIRGYRGLDPNMRSIHHGYAIVNGEEVNGGVDNSPGNNIKFPREMIDHNTNTHCSIGLHVGTAEYAHGWGQRYVTLAFSPADVVSPPSDAAQHKIRVCEMDILEEVSSSKMEEFKSNDEEIV